MNWIRNAKTAYDNTAQIINNVQQFSSSISSATAVFSSTPSQTKNENQQCEKVDLSQLEPFDTDSKPFHIFIPKKNSSAKTTPPPIFHLVYVEQELMVFKTADLQLMRQHQTRLNKLVDLATAAVENHLLDKFLAFSNKNQDWEDIHLACRLGLPAYVDWICGKGDALSISLLRKNPLEGEEVGHFFSTKLSSAEAKCNVAECKKEFVLSNDGFANLRPHLSEHPQYLKNFQGMKKAHEEADGFVQLVSKLLSLGANINKCDLEGRNLLHHAVGSSTPQAVEILKLLSAQKPQEFASAMIKTAESGLNPVQLACQGNLEALKIFFTVDKRCARYRPEVLFSLENLDPNCLDYLLQHDADLIFEQKEQLLLHKPFKCEILKVVALRTPFAVDYRQPSTRRTALHTAAARSDLSGAVQLLAHGAEVDARDEAGNTPLILAVNTGAAGVVRLLLCFGADVAARNKAGVGIDQKTTVEVANIIKQAHGWSEQSKLSTQLVKTPPKSLREYSQQAAFDHQLNNKKEGIPSLRLLSLDGGAILALALADGLKPKQCLQLYLRLKDEVFNSTKRPYSAEKIEHFLQQQFGDYRTMADLRRADVKVMVTATRADINPPELILYRNYIPCNPTLLVNEQTHSTSSKRMVDPKNVIIWKAARGSSAAPTYFPSVDGSIMDGGLIANNPSVDLLADIQLCNAALLAQVKEQSKPAPTMACLVSLGTGKLPVTAMTDLDVSIPTNFDMNSLLGLVKNIKSLQNLKTILVEQVACSDGQVVERAEAWCHSLKAPFFRFTPQLESEVPLDTTDDDTLVKLLWTTKVYVNSAACQLEIESLVDFLTKL